MLTHCTLTVTKSALSVFILSFYLHFSIVYLSAITSFVLIYSVLFCTSLLCSVFLFFNLFFFVLFVLYRNTIFPRMSRFRESSPIQHKQNTHTTHTLYTAHPNNTHTLHTAYLNNTAFLASHPNT